MALLTTAPLLAQLPGSPAASASVPLGQRAVTEAARHHGQAYLWGASGPTRFDCSGLTSYVFRRLGHGLPHSSSAQYSAVHHIRRADLRPGDLVFTVRSGRIRHVGIYAGNNRMWAATQSGDVVRTQSMAHRILKYGRVG